MKNVLVLTPSKNGINDQTRQCIGALTNMGAQFIDEPKGCSDIALARNIGLTLVFNRLQEYPNLNVVLMIDDDMLFTIENAKTIIKEANLSGIPTSGACVTTGGKFFGKPMNKNRWLCGLAFMAIPRQIILDIAARSKIIDLDDGQCLVFTWTGVEDKKWCPEDYRLCHRMGGVRVLPIRIGHLKTIPIYPANEGQEEELDEWMSGQLDKV